MCGISGIYNFNRDPVNSNVLLNMCNIMKHRGPDDFGIHIDKNLGLSHTRLSIMDLTSAGHQPMHNEDKKIFITYNGEIYNYLSIKKELMNKGHVFKSKTDTEVILHGYEEYGVGIVERLNGMFAFAIWDSRSRELFLFRDRLGIKPLYYYADSNKFVFGSEIKAILEAGISIDLEPSVLSSYLSLRYVPGEKTLFRGVKKIPPGTFIKVSPYGIEKIETYWSILGCSSIQEISKKEAQEKFYELINDSVQSRMMADVPVGAFLSGGIDSATIAALMGKHNDDVATFTFAFGTDIDETENAKAIAEKIGIRNDIVQLSKDDYEYYYKAIWHLEEPIGDSIIVPTYLLSKYAAQNVSVVQLGEGADEVLGGYVHQLAMTYGDLIWRTLPKKLFLVMLELINRVPQSFVEPFFPYPADMGRSGFAKVIQYLKNIQDVGKAYLSLAGVFSDQEKKELVKPDFHCIYENSVENLISSYFGASTNPIFQNRLLQLDLRYWNVDFTLLRMDKLTMAHSLEARVPFLDHRIVEHCLSLPRDFKTSNYNQKILLRKAIKGKNLLSNKTIAAKKQSFYLPIEKCFDSKFFDFVKDTLSKDNINKRGIFNERYISRLINNDKRELVHNKQIMVLLVFELWCQQFLDGQWRGAI